MDDNGVNVTEQSVELVRNAYQLQYTMQAISGDFAALGTAISG
jgi:flagellar basal-body rod protein FlgB